jgi:molecular chaperone DnaJ
MDLYDILGVAHDAGEADIRRAYRRLARLYHPGINPGDAEARARFEQVASAFETLADPERRRRYDQGEAGPPGAEPSSFGFEGFDFSVQVAASSSSSSAPTFGDLFGDILTRATGACGAPAEEPGADLHSALTVSFVESMTGAERFVAITRQVPCRACVGSGVVAVDPVTCSLCHGRGQVRAARGHMVFTKACDACHGTGERREVACRSCAGVGVQASAERLHVHVPAGVSDGTEVRVPGRGHAGRRGGRAGDLVLSVRVEPHPLFARDGDDLQVIVPVALHEAALGAKVEIPTFEGPVRLRIPPGTQAGQRLRLRERGAPSLRTGARGDLYVEVKLVLPALLDERSKEILREFGRINGEDVRRGLWARSE